MAEPRGSLVIPCRTQQLQGAVLEGRGGFHPGGIRAWHRMAAPLEMWSPGCGHRAGHGGPRSFAWCPALAHPRCSHAAPWWRAPGRWRALGRRRQGRSHSQSPGTSRSPSTHGTVGSGSAASRFAAFGAVLLATPISAASPSSQRPPLPPVPSQAPSLPFCRLLPGTVTAPALQPLS